ncbi:uncharacterized protein LOC127811277 [Diospyros lotus]|uniref:uncharacterized protein LOC127811277 n=1 Tax=Diospyros lotus TaxID=55363 RepID=UPI002257886D|nr:uncharacterized protein LOC127811277 [Diospyros lotus]
MRVVFDGVDEYEVLEEIVVIVVNLDTKSCDCGMWQWSDVPCSHAIAVIMNIRKESGKFINVQLKKHMYINTYSVTIHHIPRQLSWPIVDAKDFQPLEKKRKLDKPKKARTRVAAEPQKLKRFFTLQCGICNGLGHNRRTCPNAATKERKK